MLITTDTTKQRTDLVSDISTEGTVTFTVRSYATCLDQTALFFLTIPATLLRCAIPVVRLNYMVR